MVCWGDVHRTETQECELPGLSSKNLALEGGSRQLWGTSAAVSLELHPVGLCLTPEGGASLPLLLLVRRFAPSWFSLPCGFSSCAVLAIQSPSSPSSTLWRFLLNSFSF